MKPDAQKNCNKAKCDQKTPPDTVSLKRGIKSRIKSGWETDHQQGQPRNQHRYAGIAQASQGVRSDTLRPVRKLEDCGNQKIGNTESSARPHSRERQSMNKPMRNSGIVAKRTAGPNIKANRDLIASQPARRTPSMSFASNRETDPNNGSLSNTKRHHETGCRQL